MYDTKNCINSYEDMKAEGTDKEMDIYQRLPCIQRRYKSASDWYLGPKQIFLLHLPQG